MSLEARREKTARHRFGPLFAPGRNEILISEQTDLGSLLLPSASNRPHFCNKKKEQITLKSSPVV